MADLQEITQHHLSVFAVQKSNGKPIIGLPFYAEVGIIQELLPFVVTDELMITDAVHELMNTGDAAFAARIKKAFGQALPKFIVESFLTALSLENRNRLYKKIIDNVRAQALGKPLTKLSEEQLIAMFSVAVERIVNEQAIPQPDQSLVERSHTFPLGVLATDHVGYLSFDLTKIPAEFRKLDARPVNQAINQKTSVWLYPKLLDGGRIDALAQGRISPYVILTKLEFDQFIISDADGQKGFPAMQNPDISDWQLSPASFAITPQGVLGDGGCEELMPANLSLQEFYFYEVIRLVDKQDKIPLALRPKFRLGYINEYRTAWYALGHSLGQIQYSLPLAPGESVNLAVIDWSRRDKAQRTEDTKVNEQLVHNEHRDRMVSETVSAALQERQHGSSFMGGVALAVGAAGTIGTYGAAAGLAGSLGGSTATSDGTRDLTANTIQHVSDNITQASASARELQSTVVVQTTQEEKEAIETRTIVNYNHSHALTILYYEILRHYRVVTELVQRRPALLMLYDVKSFKAGDTFSDFLWVNRVLLKANLLDARFGDALDILEKVVHQQKIVSHSSAAANPGKRGFVHFMFEMTTGGIFSVGRAYIDIGSILFGPGLAVELEHPGGNKTINGAGSFRQENSINNFVAVLAQNHAPVLWEAIDAILINVSPHGADDASVSFKQIKVVAFDTAGNPEVILDHAYEGGHFVVTAGQSLILPTRRSPAPPPFPPTPEIADTARLDELLDHLERNKEYYNRVIWLNENPLVRATLFDTKNWDGTSTVLDHIENKAVEIIGSWVAFPSADKVLADAIEQLAVVDARKLLADTNPIVDERLVTLPARGVFAEAKLGHCNASEEIDNWRFWDWQQSPIPHMAPDIAPVNPVTPQAQQQNLSPTAFPSSIVNIVNPPNVPDPTGLAAAMNVLATPNIFRDMSGQTQVADLLKKLSDNSISIAQAGNMAKQIQANAALGKPTGGATGGGTGGATGSNNAGNAGIGGARANPTQPSAVNRDLQDLQNVVKRAEQAGLITPQQARQTYQNALNANTAPGVTSDPFQTNTLDDLSTGEFASLRDAGRLNITVARTLSDFMSAPLDSWRHMIAKFALRRLESLTLLGIILPSEGDRIKDLFLSVAGNVTDNKGKPLSPDVFFELFTEDTGNAGLTRTFPNNSGGRSTMIFISAEVVNDLTVVDPRANPLVPITTADVLTHELTHHRNQEAQARLLLIPDTSDSVYVDSKLAAACTAENSTDLSMATVQIVRSFVEEVCARHVVWRVENEQLGSSGILVLQPEQLAMAAFRYFVAEPGTFIHVDKLISNRYIREISKRDIGQQLSQVGKWLVLCTAYSFSDVTKQNEDVRKLFNDAGQWALQKGTIPSPALNDIVEAGLMPLVTDLLP